MGMDMISHTSPLLRHSVSVDDYESFPRSDSDFANDKESWSSPPENKLKLRVSCLGYFLQGVTIALMGLLLPLIQLRYRKSIFVDDFRIVALVLAPLPGLVISGVLSTWIVRQLGIRGVLFIGSFLLTISYFLISLLYPSYIALFMSFVLASFGYGLLNLSISTWVGTFEDAFRSLSALQSWYYAGGLSVTVLSRYVTQPDLFLLVTGLSLILSVAILVAFRDENAQAYAFRVGYHYDLSENKRLIKLILDRKQTYGIAVSLFLIYGLQVAGSTWLPIYLYNLYPRNPSEASFIILSFYWSGLSAGSILLSRLSDRFKNASRISASYTFIAIIFTTFMLYILNLYKNTIFFISCPIFFIGFFISPLPASFISKITAELPDHLQLTAVTLIVSIAQSGLSLLPFIFGFVTCLIGHQVLIPMYLFLLCLILFLWSFLAE